MLVPRIRTISFLLLCFCLGTLSVGAADRTSARDLRKDNRWHNYDSEDVTESEGNPRVGDRKTVEQPANQASSAVQVDGAAEVKTLTPTEGTQPNIVPATPPEAAEGNAGVPDPKRDNLEAAKKMLEEQLKRLKDAREAREKEKAKGGPPEAGAPPANAAGETGAARDVMVLYLDPTEVRPEVGNRFVATVRLVNPPGKELDELGFQLRYDPNVLRVVDGEESEDGINAHDRSFREAFPWETGADYVNRVDPARGLVSYRSKRGGTGPLVVSGPIASVTFEVLQDRDTSVSFGFFGPENAAEGVADGSPATYVRYKGKDILGQGNDPEDGTVDATVRFYETPPATGVDAIPVADQMDYETRIVISPVPDVVHTGEEFDYLVEIVNPNRVDFDEIMLVLGFNPKYLTPMDHDAGNYIRDGMNLFDGDYHGTFPFNHHRRNEINPREGYMLYRMGTLRTALSGSGVVASVRFRAAAPTGEQGTRLKVGFIEKLAESGLTRRGRDVLGDPDEGRDGFEVYPVMILPQGMTQK